MLCSPLPTSVLTYLMYNLAGKKPTQKDAVVPKGIAFTGAKKLGKIGKSSYMVGLQPCPEHK